MIFSELGTEKGRGRLLVALTWLVCVVIASFLPISVKSAFHTKGWLHPWDHLFAFALGGAALSRVTTQRTVQIGLLLCGMATGCFLELAQNLVYQSDIELMDVLMDTIGVGVGALAIFLWERSDLHPQRNAN